PPSHKTASTNIVEQREIISAILALQKQQNVESNAKSNHLSVESSGNGTSRSIPTLDRSENPSSPPKPPALTPASPSERKPLPTNSAPSPKIVPFRPHVAMAMPKQDFPPHTAQQDKPERSAPQEIPPGNSRSDDTPTSGSNSTQSLRSGTQLTPSESTLNEEKTSSKALDLFLMKPVIQDLDDIIQLSWRIHKLQMPQSWIEQQKEKDDLEKPGSTFEVYEGLYAHENKAIEVAIANAGAGASLALLKRTYVDMRHWGICFQGVPGLQFNLERIVPRESTAEAGQAADLEKPEGPSRKRSRKRGVGSFHDYTEGDIKAHSNEWELSKRRKCSRGSVPSHGRRVKITRPRSPSSTGASVSKATLNRGADRSRERDLGGSRVGISSNQNAIFENHSRNAVPTFKGQKLDYTSVLELFPNKFDEEELSSQPPVPEVDVTMTSDVDEDDDMDGEQEGVDDKEAERVVHELLGRYTTLYDR
ncbi:MAG: hypothetical protein Q9183_006115, partial [Haloplaca sp. 2 TL-2023]